MDKREIDIINKRLVNVYGKSLDGRANYRLVWSDSQFETRVGDFSEYYGDIFVRNYKGAKEVPKYNYIKERWILEKLEYISNPEILTSNNGTYEPIWVFQDKNGNYLDPIWRAVEFILDALSKPAIKETETAEDIRRRSENYKKYIVDYCEDKNPYLAGKIHDREASVASPGMSEKYDDLKEETK